MTNTNMCSNFGGKWDSPAPTLEWLFLFCYAGGLSLYVFNHLAPTLEWLFLFCYAGGLSLYVFNHLAPTLEWLFLFCYAGGLSLYVFFWETATMKFAAEKLDFNDFFFWCSIAG